MLVRLTETTLVGGWCEPDQQCSLNVDWSVSRWYFNNTAGLGGRKARKYQNIEVSQLTSLMMMIINLTVVLLENMEKEKVCT